MSQPSGPDEGRDPVEAPAEPSGNAETASSEDTENAEQSEQTEQLTEPAGDHEPETEVMASTPADDVPDAPEKPDAQPTGERRFTAPSGFDAGSTEKIDPLQDPETEVLSVPDAPAGAAAAAAPTEPVVQHKPAVPQHIPPRGDAPPPPPPATRHRSWGWVVAVLLVIAALVAIAILGTVMFTRGSDSRASQEDLVRQTIQNFDVAIQKGDLATLRSITCGSARDSYVNYDEQAWADTHARVAAAKQYPVVASIDQVVVNGDHAEANVTTFMAYAPQTRSTRSFDLQFRDDQWKICQAPIG
ncbi:DUF4878 domain-containing protein [Mycobacterium hubeiense]|uniref:Rv0361 family membrane protein n=1 Tax=Mycobacterium hubeiense TaxID=1867256 RepID=UPI000C7F3780|nr:DUF4878 domain-containing protein [Mycobacterium sp. QGD 101]